MSSSKIEEVGEARRSMNAVEGLTDYGLQFTDANPLLTFIPLSRKRRLPYLRGAHPAMLPLQKIANCQKNGQKLLCLQLERRHLEKRGGKM